jgi:hypothetical protein
MKIYIHWNGFDFYAPPGSDDKWENYRNPDSAKMFLVCAASWRMHGWEPVRLDSSNVPNAFRFRNRLAGKLAYPRELWDIWYQFTVLAPCWFATTDVINYGFEPAFAKSLSNLIGPHQGLSLYGPSWSNCAMFVTKEFAARIICRIIAVDGGDAPFPSCVIPTDEAIIREWADAESTNYKVQANQISLPLEYPFTSTLVHYGRSTLQRSIDQYSTFA